MERLTKKELRTLLECIKECYPNCDLETFTQRQRVVSRLSKIVHKELIPHTVSNPRTERNACATYPHKASDHVRLSYNRFTALVLGTCLFCALQSLQTGIRSRALI
jgi:hypothetical protein